MLGLEIAWQWPPALVVVGALVATKLYAQAFSRLRRRGRSDHASAGRALAFGAALAIGVLALVSPLDRIAEKDLLSAHMLQHVLIGDLVPALIVVAVRGPIAFHLLPPGLLRPLASSRVLRAAASFLMRPAVAFLVWAAAIAGWHVPPAYDAALGNPVVHELEHATFFLGGLLVWIQLVDPARRRRLTPNGRIAYALILFTAGSALVNVLFFSSGPLYPAYAVQHAGVGLSPLTDQRAAALVMMLEQLLTLGTLVAVLLRQRIRELALLPAPAPGSADRHPLTL